jgi:hypothetical protein
MLEEASAGEVVVEPKTPKLDRDNTTDSPKENYRNLTLRSLAAGAEPKKAEEIKEPQERNRQYYLASPEHFVLNAGHTDGEELKDLTQTLVDEDVAVFIEEQGKRYMAFDNEKLIDYLQRH